MKINLNIDNNALRLIMKFGYREVAENIYRLPKSIY